MDDARAISLSLIWALAAQVCPAHAQDAGPELAQDAATQEPELVAPVLLEGAVPEHPAGEDRGAVVELELTLDATGRVSETAVTVSGGPAFDAAAATAAQRMVFSPARREGVPIAAKIPFRFEFAEPLEAPPQTPPAEPKPAPPPQRPASEPVIGETEVVVRGAPPPREPTRHTLDLEQVRTVPGTGGDVLRSVEVMPGVARPNWGDGVLIVRGSAPGDSVTFVDGTPVPFVYHLGDTNSVIPGDVLDRLDFYPGSFGPRFGRALGGVIDVGLRSPRRDRVHARAQVDVIDARALIEAPLGSETGVLVAARRSWIDAWFGEVLGDSGVQVQAAPVYWDGQAILEHDFSARTRGRLSFFAADDRLELLIRSPSAQDPSLSGALGGGSRFLRTQAVLESELAPGVQWNNTLSWGLTDLDQRFGTDGFVWTAHELAARSDLRAGLAPWASVIAGLDVQWSFNDVLGRFRPYPEDGTAVGPYFGRPARTIDTEVILARPAGYAGLEIRPVPALRLLPSLRTDYASDTGDVTFDPRFSARWDVQTKPLRTTLKAGAGVFHQPPSIEQGADVGPEGIASSRALHTSLGVEQELARGVTLSLEGFYKRLTDLIVARADETRLIGARFENTGEGNVYGGEALVRVELPRLGGFVAYTLSRSERRARPGEPLFTFEWDQTHILSVSGSGKLGRGWTLGARFRYVTGTPYTPYVGGIVDLDSGAYAPLTRGAPYGDRLSDFHQLDLRVEKQWAFEAWKLAVYLEVRNAYNHRSVEGVTYNYDYSQQDDVEGLPILPVLGIRGEI